MVAGMSVLKIAAIALLALVIVKFVAGRVSFLAPLAALL